MMIQPHGSSKSTGDQASSDSGSSRENLENSDWYTASGDCFSCSDTNRDIHRGWLVRNTEKESGHPALVKQGHGLDGCSNEENWGWSSRQCGAMQSQDHQGQVETCTLADDCTSFEMRWIATRTDQLICTAEATGSKIYTRESEAEA